MKLSNDGIKNTEFRNRNYICADYNREAIRENTLKSPEWIHFGAGNIFRAFQANLQDKLLEKGRVNTGLLVCEGFDYEIVEKMYRPHDNLSILVTLKADGSIEKKIISSIVESLVLNRESEADFERLKSVFENPSLKMVSFTITEKGYVVKAADGTVLPIIQKDIDNGPDGAESYMGKVVALLYHRFLAGGIPVAMVSMDNCSHNGDKLYDAVMTFAKGWADNNKVQKEFVDYVGDPQKVSFPWSMIDKITPRPDAKVMDMLKADGVEDLDPVVTSKNTYIAPFVNAEETEYLVIEDAFPNGKLPLDEVGVIYTQREIVDKTEKMKVCTCLNPLHTSLAIFGCLLGYKSIHDEMDDSDLCKLVTDLGYNEGMKVVVNPGVLSPEEFLDAVLKKRLPNPFMPDTPQRIACDTSQKIPIRFGETIKAYRKSDSLNTGELKLIPLVLAGYLRYLKGVDDNGNRFELSPDPMLEELTKLSPKEVLMKKEVFGVDLFEDGLGERVLNIFEEFGNESGSVRKVLHKYLS